MINVIETFETKYTATGDICVVTRHNEEAVNDFLRWQVGTYESRPLEDPIYTPMTHPDGSPVVSDDGAEQFRLIGYEANPIVCCKVFHLFGFGSTLRKANSMAAPKIHKK